MATVRVILEAKSFKVVSVDNDMLPGIPRGKVTVYRFKHKHGKGHVTITHGKGHNSSIDWDGKFPKAKPDPDNARRIMKTVEVALRHHVAKHKPKRVEFHAPQDTKDISRSGKHNRRDALYRKVARRYVKKGWKDVTSRDDAPGTRTYATPRRKG